MRSNVKRLRAAKIALRPFYRVLAAMNRTFRALQLRAQLWNFKHGKMLTGLHMVANIHANLLDVIGHPGMNVDLLEGNKVARECDVV